MKFYAGQKFVWDWVKVIAASFLSSAAAIPLFFLEPRIPLPVAMLLQLMFTIAVCFHVETWESKK